MRVVEIEIKNYRSFAPTGAKILFPSSHSALVGKNNSGKSNILRALSILLGSKNPKYQRFEEKDFFDPNLPIEIKAQIGNFTPSDKPKLFGLPNLTVPQKGALNTKLGAGTAEVSLLLRKNLEYTQGPDDEENVTEADAFEIKLWGFQVHRKVEEIRNQLIRMLIVPAVRDPEDDLSASRWTQYGQLMKEVLEASPQYADIKTLLQNLNHKIQLAFASEKTKLVSNARIVSYVEDIAFQLTKDNQPSELLRNLEVFVKDAGKLFNISDVGTGTQNAIIIGILELVLKSKVAKHKLFGIEEPEAFIHPHGIRYLGSLIRSIGEDRETQIIVSTHSLSLVSNFEPSEIVRVNKVDGETVINQGTSLPSAHYKRFINQDNAELFYSDVILLVEGATERHLMHNLDKFVKQDPTSPDSDDCNFDRINLGVIEMGSKDNILNYIKIADAFNVPYAAILDNDFLSSAKCRQVCSHFGIAYQTTNIPQLINDLKSNDILVIPQGEIEDIFPDADISAASGKSTAEIAATKSATNKTSNAFKTIFGMSKPEYAMKLADYYITTGTRCPLENVIRKTYNLDFTNISF